MPRGPAFKYPWDKWFARRRLRLTRGKHFDCQPHAMAIQIRNQATKREVRVSISIIEQTLVVHIGV